MNNIAPKINFRIFLNQIKIDSKHNQGNYRCLLMILAYRLAHLASVSRKQSPLSYIWSIPILIIYRFLTEWVFQYEIPAATIIGCPLIIDHGYGIVINKHCIFGDHIRIKHGVTIGAKTKPDGAQGPSPIFGSNIDIGAHATIIGEITVGSNVLIGAGAVVVKNVPSDAIAIGNPARIIHRYAK